MSVMEEKHISSTSQRNLSDLAGKVGAPLIIVTVIAAVQLFRFGADDKDNLFLFIGSLTSLLGVFSYVMALAITKKGQKSFIAVILTAAGFIPYLFGVYLVLYMGLWQLKDLLDGFSLGLILSSLFFIVVGWYIVKQLSVLTEYGKSS